MSSHLLCFLSSFLLTPYHLLLFAHHYLSPLSHAIPSFSSTLTPAPHTTSSSPLYYLSSIPIMPYHPLFFSRHLLFFILCHLLFIPHHPSTLCHIIPSCSSTIIFISCLYPPSLFIPCHPLFFITHHPFSLYHIIHSFFLFHIPSFHIMSSSLFHFISTPPLGFSSLSYFHL